MAVRRLIKELDAFPKVEENYQQRSALSGLTTFIVSILLIILVLYEVGSFRSIETKYEYFIDHTASSPLAVNVDISVAMRCEYITMTMWDYSGTVQLDLRNRLSLQPTMLNMGHGFDEKLYDGSNLEALKNIQHFVHTANQARNARRGLPMGSKSSSENNPVDGCRLTGTFNINKVSGRFQIMGMGHGQGAVHTPHEALNFTHKIHRFSFGKDFPGIVNPLDGRAEETDAPFQMYQYFLSIIPTTYVDSRDNIILTNQYAVTEYARIVDHEKGSHGIPGILIKFDMEPLLIRISEQKNSILHLLTRLCGVVGGIFVTTGLVNGLINWFVGQVKNAPKKPF